MNQRSKLDRLCRYITRHAIADERLARNQDGQVVLTLKTPYRDGTTHSMLINVGVYFFSLRSSAAWAKKALFDPFQ